MKKWKVLYQSDRSSQNSSIHQQSNSSINDQTSKIHKLNHYVPLKRSKNNSQKSNGNINVQHYQKLTSLPNKFLPNLSQKYIKNDLNSVGYRSNHNSRDNSHQKDLSNQNSESKASKRNQIILKMKTQCYEDQFSLKLGMSNLEDLQQGKSNGDFLGWRLSQRGGSMSLKRDENLQNKNQIQRQTQRNFFKQTSLFKQVEKQQLNKNSLFKKRSPIKTSKQQIKPLLDQVYALRKLNIQIKSSLANQIQKFSDQITKQQLQIKQALAQFIQNKNPKLKDQSNEQIQKILQEYYNNYKPKVDLLQQQKQKFLQALIKMAPV